MKTRRIVQAGVLLAAALIAGVPAATAQSSARTPDECDASSRPIDWYRQLGSGVSYGNLEGRDLNVYNGAGRNYSFAALIGPLSGDQVWIDRSVNKIPDDVAQYPSTEKISELGGWKQCGPFQPTWWDPATKVVINWDTDAQAHYAVRGCARLAYGRGECGRWYIDRG